LPTKTRYLEWCVCAKNLEGKQGVGTREGADKQCKGKRGKRKRRGLGGMSARAKTRISTEAAARIRYTDLRAFTTLIGQSWPHKGGGTLVKKERLTSTSPYRSEGPSPRPAEVLTLAANSEVKGIEVQGVRAVGEGRIAPTRSRLGRRAFLTSRVIRKSSNRRDGRPLKCRLRMEGKRGHKKRWK